LAYGVPAKPVRKLERVHIDGLWSPFDELNLLDKIYRKAGLFKFADKNR
jgi:hypothetical protein